MGRPAPATVPSGPEWPRIPGRVGPGGRDAAPCRARSAGAALAASRPPLFVAFGIDGSLPPRRPPVARPACPRPHRAGLALLPPLSASRTSPASGASRPSSRALRGCGRRADGPRAPPRGASGRWCGSGPGGPCTAARPGGRPTRGFRRPVRALPHTACRGPVRKAQCGDRPGTSPGPPLPGDVPGRPAPDSYGTCPCRRPRPAVIPRRGVTCVIARLQNS